MTKAHFTGPTSESTFQVEGLSELRAKLLQFPIAVWMKVERKAIKQGLAELLHAIRAATPVDTGALVSSLKITSGSSKRTGIVRGSVVATAPHAHLIEYGFIHTSHEPTHKPTKRGHVPARPFMRATTEREAQRILDIFAEALEECVAEQFGGQA